MCFLVGQGVGGSHRPPSGTPSPWHPKACRKGAAGFQCLQASSTHCEMPIPLQPLARPRGLIHSTLHSSCQLCLSQAIGSIVDGVVGQASYGQGGRGTLSNDPDVRAHRAHACFRHTASPGPLLSSLHLTPQPLQMGSLTTPASFFPLPTEGLPMQVLNMKVKGLLAAREGVRLSPVGGPWRALRQREEGQAGDQLSGGARGSGQSARAGSRNSTARGGCARPRL